MRVLRDGGVWLIVLGEGGRLQLGEGQNPAQEIFSPAGSPMPDKAQVSHIAKSCMRLGTHALQAGWNS